MSEPINPSDKAQMRAWAMSMPDSLSWRAQHALEHPDAAMTTGNGWDERLEAELQEIAISMYRRIVPEGYCVVKQFADPIALANASNDALRFDIKLSEKLEQDRIEGERLFTQHMAEIDAAIASFQQAEPASADRAPVDAGERV